MNLVTTMREACYYKQQLILQENAVLANPDLFVDLAYNAPINLVNQGNSQKDFFKWLEIMNITCKMFSEFIYYPHEITVQDGFLLPDISTDKIFDIMLDATQNPYLTFIKEEVLPIIPTDVDFVWLNGQPKTSSLAIVSYIKKLNPKCIVAVRNHSSEYYSLNKIQNLLQNNRRLFSLINCIALDDNQTTYDNIEKVASTGSCDFSSISNVLFYDASGDQIIPTSKAKLPVQFKDCISIRNPSNVIKHSIGPDKVVNLRLNPNTQCFWKKCSFCGINEKYAFITDSESEALTEKCDVLSQLIDDGARYFWFEDEAVAPVLLSAFADEILSRKLKFEWQVRSRFHRGFSELVCKKLYDAGLREIRFGLESACIRVLQSMNKFDEDVNLPFVEQLVERFVSAGIHVHFPMIVGYPTETPDERKETYDYLNMLKEKYLYFSFNVNVLMLDVSSRLFKSFTKYGIKTLSFPCNPGIFLGNMVSFDCDTNGYSYDDIDDERVRFMLDSLYEWIPRTAITKSHIYYRLSETIRNTLIWSSNERRDNLIHGAGYLLVKNPSLSIWKESDNRYYFYNWNTHNIIACDEDGYRLWEHFLSITPDEIGSNEQLNEMLSLDLIISSAREV